MEMERLGILIERGDLFKEAVELWGDGFQAIMLWQEMSELSIEVTEWLRGEENYRKIAEEMVDVRIMLDQLEQIGIARDPEFQRYLGDIQVEKLERLKKRIKDEKLRRADVQSELPKEK